MSRQTFLMSRDYIVKHEPVRKKGSCSGFLPRVILIFALVSAVIAIIVLSVFYVEQKSEIKRLQVVPVTPQAPLPPTSTAAPKPPLWSDYRLPKTLTPVHYDLRLQVFLPFEDEETSRPDAFTTKGAIDIHFDCATATRLIVIHAWNLTFQSYGLSADGFAIGIRPPVHDVVRHLLIFEVDELLQSGRTYILHLQYKGLIVSDNQGFYRSSYVVGGKKRWLAATHFQAFKARRMFPCFDEPEFRATFDIALKHDTRHSGTFSIRSTAKSEPVGTTEGVSWTITTFERTERMPSYITAFLVSDFPRSVTLLPGNPQQQFGMISRAGVLADTDFARDVGIQMVNYFGTLFSMSYFAYNNRLDMAALPDFDPGAMENWGLILYREGYMLYRPGVSTAGDKRGVAGIVAHELAHQWFGNAVTCSWWSETFLNEGFATYLEYPLTGHVKPEWKMSDLFTSRETRTAYDIDSYESSIPLYREVNTQDETSQMFGAVTYQKGAAVLRMMEGVMGTTTMFAALTKYLAERSVTGITTYQLLLNALTAEMVTVNMTERFEKWIRQSGFPLVTVILEGADITLRQERFLLGNSSGAFDEQTWNIPFSFRTDLDVPSTPATRRKLWLTGKQGVFLGSVPADRKWILANIEHYVDRRLKCRHMLLTSDRHLRRLSTYGYYRVNYDPANWRALVLQLNDDHQVIHLNNRVQLVDDAFSLARKGLLLYGETFDVVSYLQKETEYPPWLAAFDSFEYIDTMLGDEPACRSYMTVLLAGQYGVDFWNTQEVWVDDSIENYHELSRRSLIIEKACYYGIPQCTLRAKAEFEAYKSSVATTPAINPHLRDQILCYGMRQGGEAELDFMLERYDASEMHAVKLAHLQGAACSNNSAVIDRLLTITINSKIVRSQDMGHIFGYISKFPLGVHLAWKFVRDNWTVLRRRSNIIGHICTKLKTAEELEEVSTFFASLGQNIPEKLAFEEAITKISANIEWLREHKTAVVAALSTAQGTLSSR